MMSTTDATLNNLPSEEIEQPIKLAPEEIENLIFGGGGAAGLAYAGVLWRLAQIPGFSFENIQRVAGTSIGAIAALAVSLKLTPQEMLEKLSAIDFKQLKDRGSHWEVGKRFVWDQDHYLYKGNLIYHHVLQLLQEVTGRKDPEKITFQDLKNAGCKNLYIIAARLIDTKPQPTTEKVVFSFETTPNVSIATAIRASTAAYPYFRPVRIDGYDYVDGGFKDNLAAGIFNYPKYINNEVSNRSFPREMYDYIDRRRAIKNGILVDREHNPHSLSIALVNSDSNEPYYSGNIVSTSTALINGLISKEDHSLNPRVDNKVEILKKVKLTEFDINDKKQKEIIVDGAREISKYFNEPQDEAYESDLCLRIDEIKKDINKKNKSTADRKWSMWKQKPKNNDINHDKIQIDYNDNSINEKRFEAKL